MTPQTTADKGFIMWCLRWHDGELDCMTFRRSRDDARHVADVRYGKTDSAGRRRYIHRAKIIQVRVTVLDACNA